jgi:hypothetical protein
MLMKDAWELLENLNDMAHDHTWDLWIEASEADDEELREKASEVQQAHFRKLFRDLDLDTQFEIVEICEKDDDFNEQFDTYHGEE